MAANSPAPLASAQPLTLSDSTPGTTLKLTFSAPVARLRASDLVITNGSVAKSGIVLSEDGLSALVTVQARDNVEGVLSLRSKSTLTGVDGQRVSSDVQSVRVDTRNPTVTFIENNMDGVVSLSDQTVSYTARFSEAVQRVTAEDIRVAGGQLQTESLVFSTDRKSVTFKVRANDNSTDNLVVALRDSVTDAAGNKLAANSNTLAVDTVRSNATILNNNTDGVVSDADRLVSYTVVFEKAIQAISAADLAIAGGRLVRGSLSLSADGKTASFTVAANDDSTQALEVSINESLRDASGNAVLAARSVLGVDTTNPIVRFVEDNFDGVVSLEDRVVNYKLTFSEAVQSISTNDIDIRGGQLVSGTLKLADDRKSATFSVAADLNSNRALEVLPLTSIRDAAGNELVPTVNQLTVDTARATVDIAVDTGTSTISLANDQVNVTLRFSEPVRSVSARDLTLVGGQLAADTLRLSSDKKTATFAVQMNDNSAKQLSVSVNDSVRDLAGNQISSNTLSVAVDRINPTVTIAENNIDGIVSDDDRTVAYTLTFSEAVQSLVADDLTITGGTLVADSIMLSEDKLSATFSVLANDNSTADLVVTVRDSVKDAAGNALVSATNTLTVDTDDLTVTIAEDNFDGIVSDSDRTVNYVLTFSSPVESFTASDLMIAGGKLVADSIALADDKLSATFSVLADDNSTTDLMVTVTDSVKDTNGSAIIPASNTLSVDTENPTAIIQTNANRVYTTASTINGTISLSASISARLIESDLLLSTGVSLVPSSFTQDLTLDPSGNTYRFELSASDNFRGLVTVGLTSTRTDAAGNSLLIGPDSFFVGTRSANPFSLATLQFNPTQPGGFALQGGSVGELLGKSVASIGDFDGDGYDDLIVTASRLDPQGRTNAGGATILFGGGTGRMLNVAGTLAGDETGFSAAGIGDFNGDGLSDFVIGSAVADPRGLVSAGTSYVVFGTRSDQNISLSEVAAGIGGLEIQGAAAGDISGRSTASAGDFNGDGLSDVLIGAFRAEVGASVDAGRSYIVFGKQTTETVVLSDIGQGGTGISVFGTGSRDYSGLGVNLAGDVNGDGFEDIIIGAPGVRNSTQQLAGKAFVVFGKAEPSSIIGLADIEAGIGGFAIDSNGQYGLTGYSVNSGGDINGDGFADLIVGAIRTNVSGRVNVGEVAVVFGKNTMQPVSLAAVRNGEGGFVIRGEVANDGLGYSVTNVGDFDGDGLTDLLISAPGADITGITGKSNVGKSYLVLGKQDTAEIKLRDLEQGRGGFALHGVSLDDGSTKLLVSAAGDLNGDGLADLVIGSPYADATAFSAATNAGKAYVVFGNASGLLTDTLFDRVSGGFSELIEGTINSDKIAAGDGNDTILAAGGADVLYGGSGDDTFVLSSDNFANLVRGLTNDTVARVVGGQGIDTIELDGSDVVIDLQSIPLVGDGNGRIESIERFDMTGIGDNTLVLNSRDVGRLAGFNVFTASGHRQLMVSGDTGDKLNIAEAASAWTQSLPTTIAGYTGSFVTYEHVQSKAMLIVDTDVSVTFI